MIKIKRTVFLVALLGLLVAIGVVWQNTRSSDKLTRTPFPEFGSFPMAKYYLPKLNILIKKPFPTFPETVTVYKIAPPLLDDKTLTEYAKEHFGIEGEVTRNKGIRVELIKISDGRQEVEFDTEGSYFYTRIDYRSKTEADTAQRVGRDAYPDDERCKSIAVDFLKEHRVLPEDAYYRGLADNTSGAGVVSVGFGRELEGMRVWGAGAGIGVDIAKDGTVATLFKAWQDLLVYKAYPIKTPKEAFADLKAGRAFMDEEGLVRVDEKEGELVEISLVYVSLPERQKYLTPFYQFRIKMSEGYLLCFVEAVRNECFSDKEITERTLLKD